MPSGPKKRLRARRKKQGSPATDANSDRETEGLSVTGSADVDDLDSSLDTPGKGSSRPGFLDREAVSSQTDEWVRVSNFDVGTPTSQTEENDPSAEDGDVGSSRRSLDKLAEWETVTGENIPGRQEESINSLEEEPEECEAASAHSSESYTNLPSPHVAERDKDGDSSDSDRKNSRANRSSSSGSVSGAEEKRVPASTETFDSSASVDVGEDISSAALELPLPTAGEGQIEEIERLNEDSFEENILDGAVPDTPVDVLSEETNTIVDDTKEAIAPVDEVHEQGEEEEPTASSESALVATKPDDPEMTSANGEGIIDKDTLPSIAVPEEEIPNEEKEVLPAADESLIQGGMSGDEKSFNPSSSELAGQGDASLNDEKVSTDEKVASPAVDDSSAADDKEVASTSSKAEEEKSMVEVPDVEVATFSNSASTPVEKNATEKHQLEAKSSSGCCGVLYWLLGWDH